MGRWGDGLFESELVLDMLGDIEIMIGLSDISEDLQDEAYIKAEVEGNEPEIYCLAIYRPCCSHPEIVREYIDAVIEDLSRDMETCILGDQRPKFCGVYEYLMLGACAMTHGCLLPNTYLALMKELYTEGQFFPKGMQQFQKALFGPGGFKNGEPYNFESEDPTESANDKDEDEEDFAMELSEMVAPLGVLQKSIEDPRTYHVINEMREMRLNPEDCGGCGAKGSETWKSVLSCRCQERVYCSKRCKQAHWKVHKKVCDRIGRI